MSRSLRFWLAVGLSALVGVAIAAVVAVLLGVLLPRLNGEVERDNQALGIALAGQIGTRLRESAGELERLAGDLGAPSEAPKARARIVLDTFANARADLDALYVVDGRGRVVDVGLPNVRRLLRSELIGIDYSSRGFVNEARQGKAVVWSDTYLSSRGRMVVAAAAPVAAAGGGIAPDAVLVGEFDLATLSHQVAELGRGAGVLPVIVDRRGQIVAHPEAARPLRQENIANLQLVQDGLDGRLTTGRFVQQGVDYIGTVTPVAGPEWLVLVAQPVDAAFATVRSTLWAVTAGSALAIALAFVAAWFVARSVTRRVQAFSTHLQAVADGNYRAPLPQSHAEELNALAAIMRRMANAILDREAALVRSESRYRGLFDRAPLAYQSLAADGSILAVNDAWLQLVGCTRDDALGRPLADFVDVASRAAFDAEFAQFVRDGFLDGARFAIRRKDGATRAVLINGRIHHDADGSARAHCILSDITDRQRLEAAKREAEAILRMQAERAEAMLELPKASDAMDERDFLQHALAVVERLTGSRISFLHMVSEDQRTIELVTWSKRTLSEHCTAAFDRHYPVEQAGVWADALRRKAPVVLNDYLNTPGRRGLPEGHSRLDRLISVPVIEAGLVRMLLGVGNKAEDYAEFDVETVRLVSQDIWRIVSQRHAADAQRLAATVFSASAEGICITDAEERILSVNPALTAITGYLPEELLGTTPRVFTSRRHDGEFYREMWQRIDTQGVWRGEIWNRRKNGEIFPEWLTITAVRNAGGVVTHYIGSFFDISERKRAEEDIRFLAHHDVLTRLPNRALLDDRIRQAIAKARRGGEHVAVLFLDLDRFKLINDTLGHDIGDRLLECVAERLKGVLRETETVARLGGDEFVIVIPELVDIDAAAAVAQKVLEAVALPLTIDDRPLHVTPSIGISVFPDDGQDLHALLRNADTAMYHAKERGRNNFQFFTAAMNEAVQERVAIEADLRGALARGEFLLHYQPQVDVRNGEVVGMEALLRWAHPQRGLMMPDRFIPVAEETGLIVPIGAWVLLDACRQAKAWRDAGRRQLRVSVNLSARQFQSSDLREQVAAALAESGLAPQALELELTESVLMADAPAGEDLCHWLAGLGVELAIDDFGTGYSSLAYLKRFPVKRLKIDRSFVADISTDANDAAIVRAVVAMAHSLRIGVIAEGVETVEQLRFLERHGCHEIQGYFFSRPRPAAEFVAFRFPLPAA